MKIEEIRAALIHTKWASICTEIRPSILKDEKGNVKPIFCTREFDYMPEDIFELRFTSYGDSNGKLALSEMLIRGHIHFGEELALIAGAYEINYIADISFELTLLHDGMVETFNQLPQDPVLGKWTKNTSQAVLKKALPALGLKADEYFEEYDLIYLYDDLLFNGSRHVDGRPFDKPENRPTNLQIPLTRKADRK
ncbi:hypothetical protein [Pedobacter aquatilis]|uniref:hypothetical protein n=1 Tax=Pedobacter aquatilis TaxID=351343 RepID=UPI00292E4376|nr:hypothetical protein [Pedobacter aquatilis]